MPVINLKFLHAKQNGPENQDMITQDKLNLQFHSFPQLLLLEICIQKTDGD